MVHWMMQQGTVHRPSHSHRHYVSLGDSRKDAFDTYRLSLGDNFKSDIAVVSISNIHRALPVGSCLGVNPVFVTMGYSGDFSSQNPSRSPKTKLRLKPMYSSLENTRIITLRRYRWLLGLRRRSATAWFMELRVRIPLMARMFVSCVYMLYCPVSVEAFATS
jgi:hypothetical protein